jgi:aminoglycoside/choline kinase family phosphotransferase
MSGRAQAVDRFLAEAGWARAERTLLAGDASGRRYLRLAGRPGGAPATAVLMDSAPPAADVPPFLRIAGLLRDAGLSAPHILAADPAAGLVLMEDFGDDLFAALLDRGAEPEPLFALAVDTLAALHRRFDPARAAAGLPAYDRAGLLRQVALFAEVWLPAALGDDAAARERPGLERAWREALADLPPLPASLLHRDFFACNLMLLADRPGVAACGLLDFQDAGIGPVCYDLVSLLEDARRDVPPELAEAMTGRYLRAFPDLDPRAFRRGMAMVGAVRHTRIAAVFVRLSRAGRPGYLDHLPRVWRQIEASLAHTALAPVRTWFDRHLPPGLRAPLFAPR